MKKQYKIAGLGEVLWDIYENAKFPGGAPANFAAHVQQAGYCGFILSRVGEDALGNELAHYLHSLHLNTEGMQRDKQLATGSVYVTLDDKGVPSFQCSKNVAFDALELDSNWKKRAPQLDAVLWGTLAQRALASRQAIIGFLQLCTRALKVFDVNLRGWNKDSREIIETSLRLADFIKLNKEELHTLKNNFSDIMDDIVFLRTILERYPVKLAAVTLGADGCLLVSPDQVVRHPGFKVNVVDTPGSGDAFAAGLVIKFLQGASLPEIAEFSNRLGAFVATQHGAIPRWQEKDLLQLAL